MPKREQRDGVSQGFQVYPTIDEQCTLGDPETVIWASIRQVCSKEIGEDLAAETYGHRRKREIQAVAGNASTYIRHAYEFYQSAKPTSPNTAPLIYYYSMLNLAKAVCEFRFPRLHERSECYRHGISWRPSRKWLVRPKSEQLRIVKRGVWHLLFESVTASRCTLPNPTSILVRDLFSWCPEISSEYERAYNCAGKIVKLIEPTVVTSQNLKKLWMRFSLDREDLQDLRISAPTLLRQLGNKTEVFEEVRSQEANLRTFEWQAPIDVNPTQDRWHPTKSHIGAFNSYVYPDRDIHEYFVPISSRRVTPLPQVITLYSALFWLGSLVRYDPHSIEQLMDSEYWILVDGFMSQSRLWLLELMEWAIYQTQTVLWRSR